MHTKNSVFISYRRNRCSDFAQLLKEKLKQMHYHVFIDVENLGAGRFDEELMTSIDKSANYILILCPDALAACEDPEDWLRKEITHAIQMQKNIIPVLISGFEFPRPEDLPECIRQIVFYSAVHYHHDQMDASMRKLVGMMKHDRFPVAKMTLLIVLVLTLVLVGTTVLMRIVQPSPQHYYEGFSDNDFGLNNNEFWPLGKINKWEAKVDSNKYVLINSSDTAIGPFGNRIGDFGNGQKQGEELELGDCKVSVDVKIVDALSKLSHVGLKYRISHDNKKCYVFVLSPGGVVILYHKSDDDMIKLWSEKDTLINVNSHVNLQIVGRQDSLLLYLDQRLVHTEHGCDLISGVPGAFADNKGVYWFANFSIWNSSE